MKSDDTLIAKVQYEKIGWLIVEKTTSSGRKYLWPYPICRSCQIDLEPDESNTKLFCGNPLCKQRGKELQLGIFGENLSETQRLVVKIFESNQRRNDKTQWINFDQQLIPLAHGKDSDGKYWCTVRLMQTGQAKVAIVYLGKKGHKSKVQFFVNNDLKHVTSDQVGDLSPEELIMAFKAQFSDGSTTETNFTKAS